MQLLQWTTETTAVAFWLTPEEKPDVALWYNGWHKPEKIIALMLIAYSLPYRIFNCVHRWRLHACIEFWRWIKFETNLVETMATACSNCEAPWSSAYSHDLRWWIVWHREALSLSVWEVAGNLCVDSSTEDYYALQNNGRCGQETLSIQTSFSKTN